MKRANPETDQRLRSLLQKAVRRGQEGLTADIIHLLHQRKDTSWIRTRAVIITFEECWAYGADLALTNELGSKVDALRSVARSAKQKDAAGLGSLAYAFSEGDLSVLTGGADDIHIKVVAAGLERPEDFWTWVKAQASGDRSAKLITQAHKYYKSVGWPWDKAFLHAAAYLAVKGDLPTISPADPESIPLPYWVALDRHTPQGKKAVREVARRLNVKSQMLEWTSFYLESAKTNDLQPSIWWEREAAWRLHSVGLSLDKARVLWESVKPELEAFLHDEAARLKHDVESGKTENLLFPG